MNSPDTPKTGGFEEFITFRSEDERALFTEARLGQEAINFLSSPLGRLLQGRAEAERQEVAEQLLETDCSDAGLIRDLQCKAQVAGNFIRWIGEAIQNGNNAEQQLETLAEDDE